MDGMVSCRTGRWFNMSCMMMESIVCSRSRLRPTQDTFICLVSVVPDSEVWLTLWQSECRPSPASDPDACRRRPMIHCWPIGTWVTAPVKS